MAKYLAPLEPIPKLVAQSIRTVLMMPNDDLRSLPIFYDDRVLQQLQWWRERLGSKLQVNDFFTEWFDGHWVIYIAGSTANWLVNDIIQASLNVNVDSNAWCVKCSRPLLLQKLPKIGIFMP